MSLTSGESTGIDRLVLGTAQLGADYGVTNRLGMPDRTEAFAILETAWDAGIRRFDTAAAYGSEALIGDFVDAHGIGSEIRIMTKLKLKGSGDGTDLSTAVNRLTADSLKRLGCEEVDVLLFHDVADFRRLANEGTVLADLASGLPIRKLGVSVYEPGEVEVKTLEDAGMVVQFPGNLLDRRFEGVFGGAAERYARSIFQQGLLAADEPNPTAPARVRSLFLDIRAAFDQAGVNRKAASLAYAVRAHHFDHFLVGVDSADQLREWLVLLDSVDEVQLAAASALAANYDWAQLDPRRWFDD